MRRPSNYTVPLLSLSALLLLACSNIAEIPAEYSSSNDSSIAQLVAHEYLVVKITVTKNGIKTGAAKLIRGPTATNSAIADLMVIPTAGDKEIGAYAMPDPRFQRIEGASWEVVDSADTLIFVPLSADIDKVVVRPVRGRETMASTGGNFNPLPLAIQACSQYGTGYPSCDDVLDKQEYLVVRISVTADSIVAGGVTLTRGPQETNSTIADLMVIPTANGEEIGAYTIPDPRIQRPESTGSRIVDSADTFIFIPLSADIDLVTIRPARGREHVASKGLAFDPLALAGSACSRNGEGYSECDDILEKLTGLSPEPD